MEVNYNNEVVQEDLVYLYHSSIQWNKLKNKTVLITGATGMLARYFSFMLKYLNEKKGFNITILLLARSKDKLFHIFGKEDKNTVFFIQDVCEKITYDGDIDFVLHAAGNASPYYIKNDPVGIVKANIQGTLNVLDLVKDKKLTKLIYTSTREIYGEIKDQERISEDNLGLFDHLDNRACYPESKKMAETILKSYKLQYHISFNTLRIAHTYGPGMRIENDGRVMSDLIGDAVNSRDIILKSDGSALRSFCYITDAIEAMFLIMLKVEYSEAYNIANEDDEISIFKLSNLISNISASKINVIRKENNEQENLYCKYKRVGLSTSKVRKLGWKPKVSLEDGIEKTLRSFINE